MESIVDNAISSNDIKSIWEKYTLLPHNRDVDFFESGGDSLSAIKMIVEIQKVYNVEISLEAFLRNPILDFLVDVIKN